jgi:capsular polysaccharide biosynthesis protein
MATTASDPEMSALDTAGRTLDLSKISFIGYPDAERLTSSDGRPYRVFDGRPDRQYLKGVIYVPKTAQHYGCLYDNSGRRINASCIYRGTSDFLKNLDGEKTNLCPERLPVFEQSAVYLGPISRHYGHFIVESLARAWVILGSSFQDKSFLVHVRDSSILDIPYIRRIFDAMGVFRDRVVSFERPTLVRELLVPSPSIQAGSHVYAIYRDTMQYIAESCVPERSARTDQPLYVSRTQYKANRRSHLGELHVEEYIADRGGRVFHPQAHPIEAQIEAFRRHKVIVGINGSAMHNLAFSDHPVRSVQLARRMISPTYFLIDDCFDIESTYCRCLSETSTGLWSDAGKASQRVYRRLVQLRPFRRLRSVWSTAVPENNRVNSDLAIKCLEEIGLFS